MSIMKQLVCMFCNVDLNIFWTRKDLGIAHCSACDKGYEIQLLNVSPIEYSVSLVAKSRVLNDIEYGWWVLDSHPPLIVNGGAASWYYELSGNFAFTYRKIRGKDAEALGPFASYMEAAEVYKGLLNDKKDRTCQPNN